MSTATQVTGLASETLALQATNGFLGWAPESDHSVYTQRNGWDGSAVVAYADSTAYAVGKAVTYNGTTYVVRTAVLAANTTKPDVNPKFVQADNHRGPAEQGSATAPTLQFYR